MTGVRRVDEWFVREVIPLEAALMRLFRSHWRNAADIADLRQELYVGLYEAGQAGLPGNTRAFVFRSARNLLINRARREQVVSIELVAELETLDSGMDTLTPERHVSAREDLKRLRLGLEQLPPRCREVITLRRIEGLSQREAAARMGVTEHTVERQMVVGMRALVDFMLGGSGKIRREGAATHADEASG
jgi:RNA polymerase sigma factor (sigma-70 family)